MRLWLFLFGFVLVAPSSIRSDDHQEENVAVSPGIYRVDPPVAPTIGFFLDDWQPKSFITPASQEAPVSPAMAGGHLPDGRTPGVADTITVDASAVITRIPPSAFGHNANLDDGDDHRTHLHDPYDPASSAYHPVAGGQRQRCLFLELRPRRPAGRCAVDAA